MNQNISMGNLLHFLYAVDLSFPVPLSHKQPLESFADKLLRFGTLCAEFNGSEIASLCAGYTDNLTNNRAYISLVATVPAMYGRGLAKKCVQEFIDIARLKKLDAVHLYAVKSNIAAVNMYRNLGFVEWHCKDESRPDDLHLILNLQEARYVL